MKSQHDDTALKADQGQLKANPHSNLDFFIKNRLRHFTNLRRAIFKADVKTEFEIQLLKFGKEVSLQILEARREIKSALKATELAEQKAKRKDQLFYALSHEIRTPLNGIMGLIDLLMESDLNTKQTESLRTIKQACDSMFAVCNDALDLSKLNAGKMAQRKIPFHLHEILQSSIRLFHARAKEKMIDLILEVEDNLPDLIIGDPYRLNQVIMNLLSNAIKFTFKGRVILKVNRVSESEKDLSLLFSVTDTGPGIPANRLGYLFEEFSQLRPDSEIALKGTGLGLCITKKIVEMMAGHIEVQSQENEGSSFNVVLLFDKAREASAENKKTDQKACSGTLDGFRILLAEDNPVNQLFGEKVLQNAGAKVSLAGNGAEAVQKLRTETFDLLLMDLRMPFMDGFEAARIIRKLREKSLRNIPIIALTATSGHEVINKCMEAGINAYLLKPFSAEVLIDRILSMFPASMHTKASPFHPQT